MANECLVTKLKGTVDNDMLCGFNEVRIKLQPGEHFKGYLWQYPGNSGKIILISGSATVSEPSGSTLPMTIITSSTLYDIIAGDSGAILSVTYINNLYDAGAIVNYVPLSLFEFQVRFTNVNRLSNIAGSPACKLYGDLSTLRDSFNIGGLAADAENVYGDIRYVGRLPIATLFRNNSSVNITGDLINIAKIARGKNRTTGNITIQLRKDVDTVKFNGTDLPIYNTYFKGGVLSWTSTTITFGETTIENSDVITE